MTILTRLRGPEDLRTLSGAELSGLCEEIRGAIIQTVARTGGHLGSSLGVVELAVALHRVLRSPEDRILWDTGHQAYAHKLLTGRLDRFGTLRQVDGIGGFPRRGESPHDVFDGGHAGTGLSIAQGLANARDLQGSHHRIAVVVGDAALMSGLSLEALNDIGHRPSQLLIVLNDNEMSISPTVGALSTYLSRIKLSGTWRTTKGAYDHLVERVPVVGRTLLDLSRRLRASVVTFAQPGQLFEELGITYIGVIDGHDLRALEGTVHAALQMPGPVLVHVRTQKGRGYPPAEADRVGFHGAALPEMKLAAEMKLAPAAQRALNGEGEATLSEAQAAAARRRPPTYTQVMAQELIAIAADDPRVVAITAGMPTGTGLNHFQAAYPERFIDVGICEPHAVTLATGLALGGMRPFVAIYSTFLQRALDAQIHDLCQNDQPVVMGVDRAGLVGEDGTSHQGIFTLPAQRQIPHLVVASPKDEQELRALLRTAFAQQHPFALHYPRDPGFDLPPVEPRVLPIGRGELLRSGDELLLVGFGPMVARAMAAAEVLAADGWSVGVVNARFAQPLDRELIVREARGKRLVVTLEESVAAGGFGSAVLEALAAALEEPAVRHVPALVIGVPAGRFVDHGAVADLRRALRLDADGIVAQVREALERLEARPTRPLRAAVRSA